MAIPDAAQISQLRRMVRSSLSSLRLLSSRFAINVTSQFFGTYIVHHAQRFVNLTRGL